MAKRSQSDLALTALAVEAEHRRKAKGLIRYNYGDLVADTTPEERQRIIENYRAGQKHRDPAAAARYVEANDKEDLRAIREKRGIRSEKEGFHPPKKKFAPVAGKKNI